MQKWRKEKWEKNRWAHNKNLWFKKKNNSFYFISQWYFPHFLLLLCVTVALSYEWKKIISRHFLRLRFCMILRWRNMEIWECFHNILFLFVLSLSFYSSKNDNKHANFFLIQQFCLSIALESPVKFFFNMKIFSHVNRDCIFLNFLRIENIKNWNIILHTTLNLLQLFTLDIKTQYRLNPISYQLQTI